MTKKLVVNKGTKYFLPILPMSNRSSAKDRTIHPNVWNHVHKMYNYCYDSDTKLQMALKSLNLEQNIENVSRKDLDEFLIKLIGNDAFRVLKDILEMPDFWPDSNDLANRRNYYNKLNEHRRFPPSLIFTEPQQPYVDENKLWGDQLVTLLEQKNGISYDKDAHSFKDVKIDEIVVPFNRRPNLLDITTNTVVSHDPFYQNLVKEINTAYSTGLFTATIVLSRKLVENLLIDILIKKYPPNNNLDLYYNQKEKRHKDFSVLIDVINQKKNDFVPENRTIDQLVSKVQPFRENANLAAHTLPIILDAEGLSGYNIQYIFDLLSRLMK